MMNKWCMCTELKGVARDGFSTCMICGGIDAYGGSPQRGRKYHKSITTKNNEQNRHIVQQRSNRLNRPGRNPGKK